MNGQDYEQLTLFPADSPASPFLWPGSDEARKMTVTSGRRCCGLLKNSGPVGLLARMLLESSQWRSTRCYLTWKAAGTPAGRLLFRLVPSTPRTGGTGSPLWPTITKFDATCGDLPGKEYNGETRHAMKLIQAAKLWPMPTASPCGITARTGGRPLEKSTKLGTQVAMAEGLLPTPIATDWKNRGRKEREKGREFQLQGYVGGQLNPTWVEALMGFPVGWTELED